MNCSDIDLRKAVLQPLLDDMDVIHRALQKKNPTLLAVLDSDAPLVHCESADDENAKQD